MIVFAVVVVGVASGGHGAVFFFVREYGKTYNISKKQVEGIQSRSKGRTYK